MGRFAPQTVGRTRRLVARARDDLYDKRDLKKYADELQDGWWIGTNLSPDQVQKHITTACEVMGITRGERLTLMER